MKRIAIFALFTTILIGIISVVLTEPMFLIKTILVGAITIGVIYLIMTKIGKKNKQQSKVAYQKAVKSTKKAIKKKSDVAKRAKKLGLTVYSKRYNFTPRSENNATVQLTVIDGKKRYKEK